MGLKIRPIYHAVRRQWALLNGAVLFYSCLPLPKGWPVAFDKIALVVPGVGLGPGGVLAGGREAGRRGGGGLGRPAGCGLGRDGARLRIPRGFRAPSVPAGRTGPISGTTLAPPCRRRSSTSSS